MQQYRLNFKLLIGLAVGTMATVVVVYFIWNFQIKRRSVALVQDAEKAVTAEKYADAIHLYQQYLSIMPQDNEQRVKFALAYAALAEQPETSLDDKSRAVNVMEQTLRDIPDDAVLRKRLAKFYGSANIFKEALTHLNFIMDDPESKVLRSTYMYQAQNFDEALTYSYGLIGFDAAKEEFDPGKATSPDSIEVYLNTALVLREKKNRPELGEKVINQAVKANPNNAKAYLTRGRYFLITKEMQRAKDDIAKALTLGPEDVDILLTAEGLAAQEKEYDKARNYVDKGKKLFPKDDRFYRAGALLSFAQRETDKKNEQKALDEIDEGLKAIPGTAAGRLLPTRLELQTAMGDLVGARETIKRMREKETGMQPEGVDWYESKLFIAESKWLEANRLLVKLRPWADRLGMGVELYTALGWTYENLGQNELAIRAFDSALERDSTNAFAEGGKYRLARKGGDKSPVAQNALDKAIQDELKKPKAQQDWNKIKEMLNRHAETKSIDETAKNIIWGNILVARQEYAEARRLANDLNRTSPKNLGVQTLAIQAVQFDPTPGQGPQAALALMEKMGLEDLPYWRIKKSELMIAMRDKDQEVKQQLAGLMTGIESWTEQQKITFWQQMADRFLMVNLIDEARQCLTLIGKAQPSDLQSRTKLFDLALNQNDDAGMKAAEDEILRVVGNNTDPNYLSAEARRRLSLIRRGREPMEKVAEVRQLVSRALVGRPDWYELHLINADIELLERHRQLALENLDRAREHGQLAPSAIATHIRLLADDGQLARAAAMVDEIPESARFTLLGELYLELLFRTGKVEEAIKSARAEADASPDNAQLQYRLGQLLQRSALQPGVTDDKKKATIEQAIVSVEKAVKIQPDFPEAWYSLIVFNAMAKDQSGALKALRNAQLTLASDSLQLILAKSFEALNGWFDAETIYRAMYEADPTDLSRAQQFAAFYLSPGYRGPSEYEKATPLINQILFAGADGTLPANDERLSWARRMAAKMLAASRDYQQLLKAEKLLASNSQDGSLSLEDRLEMAQLLANRPEPESLIKAAGLFEEIEKAQRLEEVPALTLATVYYKLGKWDPCKTQMLTAIRRFPNSVRIRQTFASMLIARGKTPDLEEAGKQISFLRQLAPQDAATFELAARYAVKANQKGIVQSDLLRRTARYTNPKDISDNDVQMLSMYASLFIEIGDLDHAEQVYRLLAQRDAAKVFELASFLGSYREVDKCFQLLSEQFNGSTADEVLRVAVDVIRKRRDAVGDRFDAQIEGWFDRSLQDNPGAIPLLMAKAEFREVQKKYVDAGTIYRELLANADVTGIARAVVLNNLSFLMAIAPQNTAAGGVDPLKLVQEAAQILGPTADILDTRAVVWLSLKRYDEAIADLSLAVTDNPTAAKYFHKTQAHLGAAQNKAALESWAKAEELGLSRDSLNLLEHDAYERVKGQMEKLKAGSNVTRAEPVGASK